MTAFVLPQNEHPVNKAAQARLLEADQPPAAYIPYVSQLVDWALEDEEDGGGGLEIRNELWLPEVEILGDPLEGIRLLMQTEPDLARFMEEAASPKEAAALVLRVLHEYLIETDAAYRQG